MCGGIRCGIMGINIMCGVVVCEYAFGVCVFGNVYAWWCARLVVCECMFAGLGVHSVVCEQVRSVVCNWVCVVVCECLFGGV